MKILRRSQWLSLALVLVSLVLGAFLRRDALEAGFWSDDYLQHAMLRGDYPMPRAPYDLFRFADGTPEEMRALRAVGYYPFFAHDHFRLAMLRPLPSLLHALDFWLFGYNTFAQHVHSLFWWALAVVAGFAFLRSLLPALLSGFALLLFALDESHTIPVVWLANRSVLCASAFGFAALALHVAYRRTRFRYGRALSLLAWLLCLASGEYAFALFGFLIAFEALQPGPCVERLRSLLPAASLVLGAVVLLSVLGYGSAHSGLYTSPLDEPLGYARKLWSELPVLASDVLLGIPADIYGLVSLGPAGLRELQVCIGVFGLIAAALALRFVRRHAPLRHPSGGSGVLFERDPSHALTVLLLGALLSLLPVLGSFVSSRLVLPASLGVCALVAALARVLVARLLAAYRASSLSALSWLLSLLGLCYLHGPQAALVSHDGTTFYSLVTISRTAWPLSLSLDKLDTRELTVVQLVAADINDAAYFSFVRRSHALPVPAAFRVLSGAYSGHELRRIDDYSFDLAITDPDRLRNSVVGSLTRDREDTVRIGQIFTVPGLHVQILAINKGQPAVMRYRFDRQLEDPSLLFITSTHRGLLPVKLPPPGGTLYVPAPHFPDLTDQDENAERNSSDTIPISRAIFGGCIDYVRSRKKANHKEDRKAFVRGLADVLVYGAASAAQ